MTTDYSRVHRSNCPLSRYRSKYRLSLREGSSAEIFGRLCMFSLVGHHTSKSVLTSVDLAIPNCKLSTNTPALAGPPETGRSSRAAKWNLIDNTDGHLKTSQSDTTSVTSSLPSAARRAYRTARACALPGANAHTLHSQGQTAVSI